MICDDEFEIFLRCYIHGIKNENMRYLIYLLYATWVLVSLSSCYYDNPPPIEIEEVSFNDDVIPIFETSCIGSGCHQDGGVEPDLTPSEAYESLQGLNHDGEPYINVGEPDESALMEELDTGEMPPGSNLPQVLIETIRTWMAEGAKDN
jgi:hypothetical protein